MTFAPHIGGLKLATPSTLELQLMRFFKAPRSLVFDCWTRPEMIRRWLTGPEGWTMSVCTVDLKPGGQYRYEWRHRDGPTMGLTGTFIAIAAPDSLVSEERFDEDWTGGATHNRIDFSDDADGTLYTHTIRYTSEAARDAAMRTGMADGMEAGFAHLDAVLAQAN